MRIVRDSREQRGYHFCSWDDSEVRPGTLTTGDYSIDGLENRVAVERKSLDDLVGCLWGNGRERFERELARGRSLDLFAVVIEATMADVRAHRYRSKMSPESVLQSVIAFQSRYGTAFIWAENRKCAEYVTYNLLRHYAKEMRARYDAVMQHGDMGEEA